MKKLLLLSLSIAAATGSFAQKHASFIMNNPQNLDATGKNIKSIATIPTAKVTGDGDTVEMANISSNDTTYAYSYPNDSGYIFGTNAYGDKGYGELYFVNGNDSEVSVIGGVAAFHGTYNPASTKTVTFNVWDITAPVQVGTNIYFSGLPNSSLASVTVPITQLGIDNSHTQDSGVRFTFPTATTNVSAFFIGYEMNYSFNALNGDTIGLYTNLQNERNSAPYVVNGSDTIIINQNVVEDDSATWHDNFYYNGAYLNYYVFPITIVHYTGVTNVVNKGLSFFGNYPNPATNNTNIKFSLKNAADVTITVTDMAGRTINTIAESKMSAGEHIVTLNTSNFAAGDYIYMISTSNGARIASKLTVIK